jgi:hypothetical protein
MMYCVECGKQILGDAPSCPYCGTLVPSMDPVKQVQEEEYLGGFTSIKLAKGMLAGYGIYATSKRIIGIKSRKTALAALGGGLILGVPGVVLAQKLTYDQSSKWIKELDESKDFEIAKGHISHIEIKKPGLVSKGHLAITTRTGDTVKVLIVGQKEFEQMRDLMQVFLPESVTVVS